MGIYWYSTCTVRVMYIICIYLWFFVICCLEFWGLVIVIIICPTMLCYLLVMKDYPLLKAIRNWEDTYRCTCLHLVFSMFTENMPLFTRRKGSYCIDQPSPSELGFSVPANVRRGRKFSEPAISYSEPVIKLNVKSRSRSVFGGQLKTAFSRMSKPRSKSKALTIRDAKPHVTSRFFLWMPSVKDVDASDDDGKFVHLSC